LGINRLSQVSQDAFDCDTLSIHSTVSSTDFHAKPIEDVFYQNGVLCFIDSEHDLYIFVKYGDGLTHSFENQ
jgi:hypothetical protein